MARPAEQFEDVLAWQRARQLTQSIYRETRKEAFARDWGLTGQMQRAAVSIMANIAEGFERGKPKEYLQFLLIAKASCAEVRSHIYVALDSGYLDELTFGRLCDQARETSRIISGLRAAIERHQSAG